jgi:hypothetical protein
MPCWEWDAAQPEDAGERGIQTKVFFLWPGPVGKWSREFVLNIGRVRMNCFTSMNLFLSEFVSGVG